MADKLQGIWYFDKWTFSAKNPVSGLSFDVDFTSNGVRYSQLKIESSDFSSGNYSTSDMYWLTFDSTTAYVTGSFKLNEYKTIEIHSKYAEVEDAERLLSVLQARATHTPVGEDIKVPMTSEKGVVLKTAGKVCDRDIVVTPTFEIPEAPNIQPLTVTENGEYTPPEGVDGYAPVTVNVTAPSTEMTASEFVEGGFTEVNIPNTTKIRDYAFYHQKTLTNVIMPNVTSIGSNAFGNCTLLAITKLPSGLKTISGAAFSTCSKLALTELPSGLTSIPDSAFMKCNDLALTELPSGITGLLGGGAFQQCSKLALKSLPSGITEIGSNCFYGCSSLAITEIPSGVTKLNYNTFYGCTGLTSITFKGTPTSIGTNVFGGCKNLTTINVPWAEGAINGAPWGATNATINYNYTGG